MPEIIETPVRKLHSIVEQLDEIYLNWNSGDASVEDINALKAEAQKIVAETGLPFVYSPPVSEADAKLIEAGEYTSSYSENDYTSSDDDYASSEEPEESEDYYESEDYSESSEAWDASEDY